MRQVFLFPVILIVIIIALPVGVFADNPDAVYPGMGGTPLSRLEPIHPAIKNSSEVMTYIGDCGVGSWNGIAGNQSYTYVMISPAKTCEKKIVFMEKKGYLLGEPDKIVSVSFLGMNETFIPGPSDPLEGFYLHYPDAKNNPAIDQYVLQYAPSRWKEEYASGTTRQVYLIAENSGFRELIVTVDNGTVTGTRLIDESMLIVDKNRAVQLAGANRSIQLDEAYIRIWNDKPEWVFSWMEGSGMKMAFVSAGGFRGNIPISGKGMQNVSGFTTILACMAVAICLVFLYREKK
jgi:hypothetical protein